MVALIVTERPVFYHRCEGCFHNTFIPVQLSSYNDQELRQRLESLQPDILLLDATLGEERAMNVFALLRGVSLATVPGVFVRVGERKSSWEARFLNAGAMYVFDKYIGDLHMVDCIQAVYHLHRREGGEEEFGRELDRMLRKCCLLKKHMGYACIFDAVVEIYRDSRLSHALTKEVYPRIAQLRKTTAIRVEKNIRDAIGNAWNNGGAHVMPELLGCSPLRTPTNGEFILRLCEHMKEFMHRAQDRREDMAGV